MLVLEANEQTGPGSAIFAAFIQGFRMARAYLMPIERMLKDCGLEKAKRTSCHARVPLAQVSPILSRLITESQNEVVGLQAANLIDVGVYGIVGHIAMSCARLIDVVERIPRYESLISDLGVTTLAPMPGQLCVRWHCCVEDPVVARQIIECVIGSWVVFARWLANDDGVAPTVVCFRHAPPERLGAMEEYRKVFQCPVMFNQAFDGIWMAHDVLSRNVCYHDADLLQALEARAYELLNREMVRQSVAERVKDMLRTAIGVRVPSREWVADQLGVNIRTLYRWLNEEGTSYRTILDGLRLELAKEMIVQRNMTVAQVARQLGYADARSLTRAFKMLTGETPTAYRDRLGLSKRGAIR